MRADTITRAQARKLPTRSAAHAEQGICKGMGRQADIQGHAGTCAARRREGAVLSNPQIKVNAMSYAKLIRLMDERVKLGLPALPTKEHP